MARLAWTEVWEDSFVRIRDQIRAERAAGVAPRRGMKTHSDSQIDAYSRREANRRCEEAINRHNEEIELKAKRGQR